jgi:phosphomethylpyrimidine synthase
VKPEDNGVANVPGGKADVAEFPNVVKNPLRAKAGQAEAQRPAS